MSNQQKSCFSCKNDKCVGSNAFCEKCLNDDQIDKKNCIRKKCVNKISINAKVCDYHRLHEKQPSKLKNSIIIPTIFNEKQPSKLNKFIMIPTFDVEQSSAKRCKIVINQIELTPDQLVFYKTIPPPAEPIVEKFVEETVEEFEKFLISSTAEELSTAEKVVILPAIKRFVGKKQPKILESIAEELGDEFTEELSTAVILPAIEESLIVNTLIMILQELQKNYKESFKKAIKQFVDEKRTLEAIADEILQE